MFNLKKQACKRAFTLTELLIALGVIGILTAVTMPIVFHLRPDQNILMAKRAFYTTESVVSELLNDEFCYPRQNLKVGFDDGLGYERCKKWGTGKDDIDKKFITLFADKLDLRKDIDVAKGDKSFTTKDGIIWTFSNFQAENGKYSKSYALITVDVNGDKDPNCGEATESGECSDKTRKSHFDKFTMKIHARGKIEILDCWAIKAAKTDKKLVGNNGDDETDCKTSDKTETPETPDDTGDEPEQPAND